MRTNEKKDRRAGFTLIEMTIGVLIVGLIVTPVFIFISRQKQQTATLDMKAAHEEILSALDLYLKQNGYYPCPANPALGPGAPGGAFGRGDGTNTGNCTAAVANPAGAIGGGNVSIGALPVKELNLPYRYAADRHGWKYIYAVSRNLTSAATFDGAGHISAIDRQGNALKIGGVTFVVIDPGQDGKGAFNLSGGAATACAPAAAMDAENCNNDATFREAPFNDSLDPANGEFYDDYALYNANEQDDSFWMVQKVKPLAGDKIDVVNRNMGNVGIGTNAPAAKLHVSGGDVRIEATAAGGGTLNADKDIRASRNINADNDVKANNEVKSPSYSYQ